MSNNINNRRQNQSWGAVATGVAAALVGGLAYYFTRESKPRPQPAAVQSQNILSRIGPQTQAPSAPAQPGASQPRSQVSASSYVTNMLSRMATISGETTSTSTTSPFTSKSKVPDNPVITNLNSLLSDIFVRYIQLKDNDFELHYKVFDKIFQDLHKRMKEVDPYYRKYSSTVQFAGSHYDNLRIKKPDEFDMDIVIGIPLNIGTDPLNEPASDIILENKSAGFVQLKMGVQFQRLPMRDKEEWLVNRAAYEWKDDSNYLLRSKFCDWFKSVVNRALNTFELNTDGCPLYYVEGIPYVINKSESGPAMTLFIKNRSRGFQLDVDLVPCLKFPENRWPIGKSYREIAQNCKKGYWMVVGKPNKASPSAHDQLRSWRIALHNQEREMMHDLGNLKQAIRFMKKLRDSLGMDKVASYYVKTLFFWEIVEKDNNEFWKRNNPAVIFKLMVTKLHAALVAGKIPYFWNKSNNLIGSVDRRTLDRYAENLVPLKEILDQPSQYKLVAKYLLTPQEFRDYNARYLHI